MSKRRLWIATFVFGGLLLATIGPLAFAQWGRRGRFRSIEEDRRGVPTWDVDKQFPGDLFTFARVEYDSYYGRGGGGARVFRSRPPPGRYSSATARLTRCAKTSLVRSPPGSRRRTRNMA